MFSTSAVSRGVRENPKRARNLEPEALLPRGDFDEEEEKEEDVVVAAALLLP
jgi:hypothetical protein